MPPTANIPLLLLLLLFVSVTFVLGNESKSGLKKPVCEEKAVSSPEFVIVSNKGLDYHCRVNRNVLGISKMTSTSFEAYLEIMHQSWLTLKQTLNKKVDYPTDKEYGIIYFVGFSIERPDAYMASLVGSCFIKLVEEFREKLKARGIRINPIIFPHFNYFDGCNELHHFRLLENDSLKMHLNVGLADTFSLVNLMTTAHHSLKEHKNYVATSYELLPPTVKNKTTHSYLINIGRAQYSLYEMRCIMNQLMNEVLQSPETLSNQDKPSVAFLVFSPERDMQWSYRMMANTFMEVARNENEARFKYLPVQFFKDAIHTKNFKEELFALQKSIRIIVFCAPFEYIREIFVIIEPKGFCDGEYVFISTEFKLTYDKMTNLHKMPTSSANLTDSERDEIARKEAIISKCFRSMLVLAPAHRKDKDRMDKFSNDLDKIMQEHFNMSLENNKTVPDSVAALYETLHVFTTVITQNGSLDINNVNEVLDQIRNRTFAGISQEMIFTPNCDRKGEYELLDWNATSCSFYVVGSFSAKTSILEVDRSKIDWNTPDNQVPKFEPVCGFNGERCKGHTPLAIGFGVAMLVVLAVSSGMAYLFIVRAKFKAELKAMNWIIQKEQLRLKDNDPALQGPHGQATLRGSATGKRFSTTTQPNLNEVFNHLMHPYHKKSTGSQDAGDMDEELPSQRRLQKNSVTERPSFSTGDDNYSVDFRRKNKTSMVKRGLNLFGRNSSVSASNPTESQELLNNLELGRSSHVTSPGSPSSLPPPSQLSLQQSQDESNGMDGLSITPPLDDSSTAKKRKNSILPPYARGLPKFSTPSMKQPASTIENDFVYNFLGASHKNRKSSTADSSSLSSWTETQKRTFCTTAIYNNTEVAIKPFYRETKVETNKPLLLEVKRVKDLNSDHLLRFIGACLNMDFLCLVTEYCVRGSIADVLENKEFKLDMMFKTSMILDISRGMFYLHKMIGPHGNLTIRQCLVDSRFAIKISDFGLHLLRGFKQLRPDSKNYYEDRLWTAPELLRKSPTAESFVHPGHFHGDVYSFAIICQEILYRKGTFYTKENKYDAKEIIERVRTRPGPSQIPFRPSFEFELQQSDHQPLDNNTMSPQLNARSQQSFMGDDKHNSIGSHLHMAHSMINPGNTDEALKDCHVVLCRLVLSCWDELPENRPEFKDIRDQLIEVVGSSGGNLLDNLLTRMEQHAANLEHTVSQRTEQYMREKEKAQTLLYTMLPTAIADLLVQNKPVPPDTFDSVTIYFSDICGFTSLSAESTPMQVVRLLNSLYTTLDRVTENYDVYKVETIGDAYMVASGLPNRNEKHAQEIARMALKFRYEIDKFIIPHMPDRKLMLRIGIHTGPVCAGVVGSKMPRYCLFGDTVNTASRMESTGEPLKIHLSESTFEALHSTPDTFFVMTERGMVEMKGKGLQRTFWLHGEGNNIVDPLPRGVKPVPLDDTLLVIKEEDRDPSSLPHNAKLLTHGTE